MIHYDPDDIDDIITLLSNSVCRCVLWSPPQLNSWFIANDLHQDVLLWCTSISLPLCQSVNQQLIKYLGIKRVIKIVVMVVHLLSLSLSLTFILPPFLPLFVPSAHCRVVVVGVNDYVWNFSRVLLHPSPVHNPCTHNKSSKSSFS